MLDPYTDHLPLTHDERDHLHRVEQFLHAEREKRRLAPARAAHQQAEAAKAGAEAHRQQLYGRALDAARVWPRKLLNEPEEPLDPLVIQLQRHVIDLALEPPEITLHWLDPKAPSTRIVAPSGGVSYPGQACVVIPPVMSRGTYALALHELGHSRTEMVRDRLLSEEAAWRWARRHAIQWDTPEQERMVEALTTYIDNTERLHDVPSLMAVEALISPLEFRREKQRRLMATLAAERG